MILDDTDAVGRYFSEQAERTAKRYESPALLAAVLILCVGLPFGLIALGNLMAWWLK